MSATATPGPPEQPVRLDPEHLTFAYTENDDGWFTAQVVEFPAAISEGRTREDAMMNALEALHDLWHHPTPGERVAFSVLGELAALSEALGEALYGLGRRVAAAAERHRTLVK